MNLNFLCCIGAELKNSTQQTTRMTQIYLYRAYESETVDDMLSPGFFDAAMGIIRKDDLLLLYSPNEASAKYIYARVSNVDRDGVEIESISIDAKNIIVDTDGFSVLDGGNLQEIIAQIDSLLPSDVSSLNKLIAESRLQSEITRRAVIKDSNVVQEMQSGLKTPSVEVDNSLTVNGSAEFDNAPTTNDTTTYQNATTNSLVRKEQVDEVVQDIKTSSLTFIGYVSATEPSSATYAFNTGDLWLNSATMPTTFPFPQANIKEWNGSAWVAHSQDYTPANFNFFRNVNNNEGYYWFGGEWVVMSTDMSTTYFQLNPVSGKWEIASNVNLPGAPTTTTPSTDDNSTKIATTEFVKNVLDEKGSGAGRNIGDIFWTTRTDSALNGAVEANGAQYNFADVNQGQNNVQALLESGALPSVSIAKFDAMVAKQGGCDSFGYGTDTQWTSWEIDGINYVYTNKPSTKAEIGDPVYDAPGGNIIGYITRIDSENRTLIYYDKTDGTSDFAYAYGTAYGPVEPTTYFKVPKKLGRVLVRSQKPTEDNNYTWFNLYSDGWVEQGGGFPFASSAGYQVITFPIEFSNTNYFIQKNPATDSSDMISWRVVSFYDLTTTSAKTYNSRSGQGLVAWQASGYAAASEYTPDKWDYQNIQVLRPMVQLFNGATDEAVAKCTEVLSDVAGLKLATDGMIDYVVESQEPTSGNGYTWYRLYKSGWVEQGGILQEDSIPAGSNSEQTLTLPIEMADTNYTVTFGAVDGQTAYQSATISRTTTGGTVTQMNRAASKAFVIQFSYIVSGMSAQ